MTKDAFVASIAAEPNFLKWAQQPVLLETIGEVQKWHGIVYKTTPDGTNTEHVYFMVDSITGEATWQNQNSLSPSKNTTASRADRLEKYLGQTFFGYHITMIDPQNNWAEADIYTDGATITKSKVFVYKKGANPVTHKAIA